MIKIDLTNEESQSIPPPKANKKRVLDIEEEVVVLTKEVLSSKGKQWIKSGSYECSDTQKVSTGSNDGSDDGSDDDSDLCELVKLDKPIPKENKMPKHVLEDYVQEICGKVKTLDSNGLRVALMKVIFFHKEDSKLIMRKVIQALIDKISFSRFPLISQILDKMEEEEILKFCKMIEMDEENMKRIEDSWKMEPKELFFKYQAIAFCSRICASNYIDYVVCLFDSANKRRFNNSIQRYDLNLSRIILKHQDSLLCDLGLLFGQIPNDLVKRINCWEPQNKLYFFCSILFITCDDWYSMGSLSFSKAFDSSIVATKCYKYDNNNLSISIIKEFASIFDKETEEMTLILCEFILSIQNEFRGIAKRVSQSDFDLSIDCLINKNCLKYEINEKKWIELWLPVLKFL